MNAKSLYLTESDSIASFVPILLEQLKRNKYVLVKTNFARDDDCDKVTRNLLLYAGIIGQHLGRSLGHYVLSGHGDTSLLPVHVEGIYCPGGILRYFALGCIVSAENGGATRIFDACKAASILSTRYPDLCHVVVIEYNALAHPGESAEYSLVTLNNNGESVLVYRSNVVSNTILNYTDHAHLYMTVDTILDECVLVSHAWETGDLLFVDNARTLHDRLPYSGMRKMLRVRFDDRYIEATY